MNWDKYALQEVRESRLLIDRFDDWLFDEFRIFLGERVLEIGCGLGNHFGHLLERPFLLGFDISAESVEALRDRFCGHRNVRVECLSITDPSVLSLKSEQLDTAFSLNVFEHIEDDALALSHTWQLLQPGGRLILIVPAHQWLYGPMDASIGHYRRYSKATLRARMMTAGFEVLTAKYVNMLGALGWWVNGRLLRRRVPPRGQLRLLNKFIPAVRACESIFQVPFGVSLLMVGQKVAL
jgi:SAM-dependent methyltransferase